MVISAHSVHNNCIPALQSRFLPKTDTAIHCPAFERPGAGRLKATPQSQTVLPEHNNITTARPAPCVACRQQPASLSASTNVLRALSGHSWPRQLRNRRSEALRGRTSLRPPSQVSTARVKTHADGRLPLALLSTIPAHLVGDHEPKLVRRASTTGSGCPGAVGFQVVGVHLLPCIDDVQDRGIDHHRRAQQRQSIAYAASVSLMPIRAISSQSVPPSVRAIEFSARCLSVGHSVSLFASTCSRAGASSPFDIPTCCATRP